MKRFNYKEITKFGAMLMVVIALFAVGLRAATLSPSLQEQVASLPDGAEIGMAIVAFNSSNGLQEGHLDIMRGVGIEDGITFPNLGMVASPMTARQLRALQSNSSVRSIWSNDKMQYHMEESRVMTGVDRARIDPGFMARNGSMPVDGSGDFSVMVIDSGVDATHQDLQFGPKVIQNVQTVVAAGTLEGFTTNVSIENVQNTDQSVGHGTHCAGIIGGTGIRSGGKYAGVAPGAKIIGSGLGAALFVINGLSAWEWALANQYRYNIKVISNSYGSNGAFNPDNPITIASKTAYNRGITSVFSASNSGPAKGTMNTYAKAPWVIGVAAGSKEGQLADFSSRGLPKEERLSNSDPLDDFDAPTITAPGTGRFFESFSDRFTSDIVSTRSTSNLTANGGTADTELGPGMIPFYTQISGTSMSTPFVAGTIALMLEADPTLTPDEIKQILVETATRMPGYEEYEVGAGYLNAYAAVDKTFNRNKNYSSSQEIDFNLEIQKIVEAEDDFDIDFNPVATPGPDSPNSTPFTVSEGMNVLDIFGHANTNPETGETNVVGIVAYDPAGRSYSSGISLPILDTPVRQIIVDNPMPGTWRLEARGARGLTAVPGVSLPTSGAALPGPIEGTIKQIRFEIANIPDVSGHDSAEDIDAALKNRLMDVFTDGSFRPDQKVTREDFANLLLINTDLRQTVGAEPKFTDVTGDAARFAESVTANGSTIRDYGYISSPLMSSGSNTFDPGSEVSRIDVAVALVKALGKDEAARDLANSTVTADGAPIVDNHQIPGNLRGYVQLAIDSGLFEAYPAELVQLPNGTFQALPGPRFEPTSTLSRADLAGRLMTYRILFTTGG
ncbi:MAG: S8 family serine peptidase [Pyrinomonadaceae bacterium]|nr:S8 family serine peptidase [Pyrinomonadaceae bacterium]